MSAGPREHRGLWLVPAIPFLGGTNPSCCWSAAGSCFSWSSGLLSRVFAGENNPCVIPGEIQHSKGELGRAQRSSSCRLPPWGRAQGAHSHLHPSRAPWPSIIRGTGHGIPFGESPREMFSF